MNRLLNWIKILIKNIKIILNKNSKDNVSAIAAQSAFFIILSFAPFLMFTLAIFSHFGVTQSVFEGVFENVFIDESLNAWLKNIFYEIYSYSTGVAITTIIAALWSAGKGVYSITEGIRVIYNLPNRHNWLIKRIFSMGYTALLFIAILLSTIGLVLSEFVDDVIKPIIKTLPNVVYILYTLRYLIVFVLIVLLLSVAFKLYLRSRVEDKRYASFKCQLPGALIAAASWVVLSLGFKIYVNYFNGFSIYGSLASMTLVMVWAYFCIYALVWGIQINYIYRDRISAFKIRKLFKRKS